MENAPTLTQPVSDSDHIEGEPSASVTLVEYGDYQCPYCGAAYPVVKKVQAHFGDRLQFVFRNFPLNELHEYAELAAEAAEAAGAQGKFWEMHDTIFEHQHALGEQFLESRAVKLGLDVEQFNTDVSGRKFQERVKADFLSGVRSGVNGTPTFFINGARFDENPDFTSFVNAIKGLV